MRIINIIALLLIIFMVVNYVRGNVVSQETTTTSDPLLYEYTKQIVEELEEKNQQIEQENIKLIQTNQIQLILVVFILVCLLLFLVFIYIRYNTSFQIKGKTQQLKQKKTQLQKLNNDIDQKNKNLQNLESQFKTLQSNTNTKKGQLVTLQQQKRNLQELQNELKTKTESLKVLNTSLNQYNKQLKKKQGQRSNLTTQITAKKNQLNQITYGISNFSKTYNTKKTEYDKQITKLQNKIQVEKARIQDFEQKQTNIQILQSKIAQGRKKLNQLETQKTAKIASIKQEMQQFQNLSKNKKLQLQKQNQEVLMNRERQLKELEQNQVYTTLLQNSKRETIDYIKKNLDIPYDKIRSLEGKDTLLKDLRNLIIATSQNFENQKGKQFIFHTEINDNDLGQILQDLKAAKLPDYLEWLDVNEKQKITEDDLQLIYKNKYKFTETLKNTITKLLENNPNYKYQVKTAGENDTIKSKTDRENLVISFLNYQLERKPQQINTSSSTSTSTSTSSTTNNNSKKNFGLKTHQEQWAEYSSKSL